MLRESIIVGISVFIALAVLALGVWIGEGLRGWHKKASSRGKTYNPDCQEHADQMEELERRQK